MTIPCYQASRFVARSTLHEPGSCRRYGRPETSGINAWAGRYRYASVESYDCEVVVKIITVVIWMRNNLGRSVILIRMRLVGFLTVPFAEPHNEILIPARPDDNKENKRGMKNNRRIWGKDDKQYSRIHRSFVRCRQHVIGTDQYTRSVVKVFLCKQGSLPRVRAVSRCAGWLCRRIRDFSYTARCRRWKTTPFLSVGTTSHSLWLDLRYLTWNSNFRVCWNPSNDRRK